MFNNILQVLAFSELGIGTAITYFMYEPLREKNEIKISAYMNFYRKAYIIIGLSILSLGMLITPCLTIFISGKIEPEYYLYFVVFVINSASSYFFAYKRNLLIADQRNYINNFNNIIFLIAQTILQILVLVILKSYLGYLLIQFVCVLISNLQISKKVDVLYPYLQNNEFIKLKKEDTRKIINNTKEIVGARIGGIVLNSTDNIVLSSFVGLGIVGVYANYLLIFSSVTRILQSFTNSVIASVGHLVAEKNTQKSLLFFNRILFINFVLGLLTSTFFLVLINPFIKLWIGQNYLFGNIVVLMLAFQLAIQQLRETNQIFMAARGVYRFQGIKSIAMSLVNLTFSVVFVYFFKLDVLGVLLGTTIAYFTTDIWFDVHQDIKNGFNHPWVKVAIKEYALIAIIFVALVMITWISILNFGIFTFPLKIIITAIIDMFIIFAFYKTPEFKYVLELFIKLIKRILNKWVNLKQCFISDDMS
ncbi:MAG: hypothetical protein LBT17_00290 [Mycoplasmataceae bacterium]|nr:hypothetical protein [Mycoplasmataceae bacterium]